MNLPTFEHRGYVAVGHPHALSNGKYHGGYSIHEGHSFGKMVYRTQEVLEFDTPDAVVRNMETTAQEWIDLKLA